MAFLRLLVFGSRAGRHAQVRADFSTQLLPDAFILLLTQLALVIQFPKLSKLIIGVESRRHRTLTPAVEHRDGDGSYDDYCNQGKGGPKEGGIPRAGCRGELGLGNSKQGSDHRRPRTCRAARPAADGPPSPHPL